MEYPIRTSIIDLGSNSVRMNILGIGSAGDHILMDQAKERVRISEGMGRERTIKDPPLQRLFHTLELFTQLNQVFEVDQSYALATAAVRTAKNQAEVLASIRARTGFDFAVLSGTQEARYDFYGVINTMAIDDALLVDLGGGSTEIILVQDRKMIHSASIPFGSVNLSENYPDAASARRQAKRALNKLPWLEQAQGYDMIGLGGSIRSLAKVNRAKQRWPLFSMHNYELSAADVGRILNMIQRLPESELKRVPGISRSRSELLKQGLAPFKELFYRLQPQRLRISTSGVREGFFYSHYHKQRGLPLVSEDVLEAALLNFERRYRLNREHCRYVARLSLELFDLLGKDFSASDRLILEVAARLHDIGMHVDYYSHHLHGFYLILQSNLAGLSDEQLIQVALLVGYHRQMPNLFDLKPFIQIIGPDTHRRMQELSLFLSLAEQLDRSESQKIAQIEKVDHCLVFRLKPGFESSLEQQAAQRSLRQLQQKYRVKLEFM